MSIDMGKAHTLATELDMAASHFNEVVRRAKAEGLDVRVEVAGSEEGAVGGVRARAFVECGLGGPRPRAVSV